MSKPILKLKNYENKWVALTYPDHKVVGSGDTLAEAAHAAAQKGYPDPLFFKVPPFNAYFA